jgi:hypothetical protein
MQILLTLFSALLQLILMDKLVCLFNLIQESQETVISISTQKTLQWLCISHILDELVELWSVKPTLGLHNWMEKSQNMPVWLRKMNLV